MQASGGQARIDGALARLVRAGEARLILARALRWGGRGCLAGASAGLVACAGLPLIPGSPDLSIPEAALVALGCGVAGVIAGAAAALTRRLRPIDAARRMDDAFGLPAVLASAVEIAGDPPSHDPSFAALVIDRAQRAAVGCSARRAIPTPMGRSWWAGLAVAGAGVLAGVLVPRVEWGRPASLPETPEDRVAAIQGVEEVTREIQERREAASAAIQAQLDAQLAELAEIERELAEGKLDPAEARARAAEAAEQAAESVRTAAEDNLAADDNLRESLSGLPERSDAAKELGEALRNGDLAEARKLASELLEAQERATPEEMQELAEALDQLARDLEAQGRREIQAAREQAAEGPPPRTDAELTSEQPQQPDEAPPHDAASPERPDAQEPTPAEDRRSQPPSEAPPTPKLRDDRAAPEQAKPADAQPPQSTPPAERPPEKADPPKPPSPTDAKPQEQPSPGESSPRRDEPNPAQAPKSGTDASESERNQPTPDRGQARPDQTRQDQSEQASPEENRPSDAKPDATTPTRDSREQGARPSPGEDAQRLSDAAKQAAQELRERAGAPERGSEEAPARETRPQPQERTDPVAPDTQEQAPPAGEQPELSGGEQPQRPQPTQAERPTPGRSLQRELQRLQERRESGDRQDRQAQELREQAKRLLGDGTMGRRDEPMPPPSTGPGERAPESQADPISRPPSSSEGPDNGGPGERSAEPPPRQPRAWDGQTTVVDARRPRDVGEAERALGHLQSAERTGDAGQAAGGSTTPFAEARRRAERAIEQQGVPARHSELVRRVFRRLSGEGTRGPPPAPDAPAPQGRDAGGPG